MAIKRGGYKPKQRNSGKRKRKPIIFIIAEGNNKTESFYFKAFAKDVGRVVCFDTSNDTDPVNMADRLGKSLERNGFAPSTEVYKIAEELQKDIMSTS